MKTETTAFPVCREVATSTAILILRMLKDEYLMRGEPQIKLLLNVEVGEKPQGLHPAPVMGSEIDGFYCNEIPQELD